MRLETIQQVTLSDSEWTILEKTGVLSSNAKLEKDSSALIVGLFFTPADADDTPNVCPFYGVCKALCVLRESGRTVTRGVRIAAKRRKIAFFHDRKRFYSLLVRDIASAKRRADKLGVTLHVRLNVGSDIAWERVYPELFATFPDVVFYDYTKNAARVVRMLASRRGIIPTFPLNYSLTYSYSELADASDVREILACGGNVAVVFDTIYWPAQGRIDPLPATWKDYTVIDGDRSDVRTFARDGRGVIVGLRHKGGNRKRAIGVAEGFVQVASACG